MESKPVKPQNFLALAIISTIICCLPAGIVSIIYSTKVNSEYEAGNYDAAIKASKNAKTWGIVSIVLGILIYVFVFVIYGVALFGIMANA